MKIPISTFSSVLMKICQIPHVIFQTTSQFFFKFCMTLVSWNILLCTFLGQTLYTLHKRDQSKCKCFRLFSAQIKIHQILVIFEIKNKFSSNFAQFFGHSSSILVLAETLYTFSNFSKISPEQSKVWNFALWWIPFVKIK